LTQQGDDVLNVGDSVLDSVVASARVVGVVLKTVGDSLQGPSDSVLVFVDAPESALHAVLSKAKGGSHGVDVVDGQVVSVLVSEAELHGSHLLEGPLGVPGERVDADDGEAGDDCSFHFLFEFYL
jgi:hypothetical protein